jgi:hypothetical protein
LSQKGNCQSFEQTLRAFLENNLFKGIHCALVFRNKVSHLSVVACKLENEIEFFTLKSNFNEIERMKDGLRGDGCTPR